MYACMKKNLELFRNDVWMRVTRWDFYAPSPLIGGHGLSPALTTQRWNSAYIWHIYSCSLFLFFWLFPRSKKTCKIWWGNSFVFGRDETTTKKKKRFRFCLGFRLPCACLRAKRYIHVLVDVIFPLYYYRCLWCPVFFFFCLEFVLATSTQVPVAPGSLLVSLECYY